MRNDPVSAEHYRPRSEGRQTNILARGQKPDYAYGIRFPQQNYLLDYIRRQSPLNCNRQLGCDTGKHVDKGDKSLSREHLSATTIVRVAGQRG